MNDLVPCDVCGLPIGPRERCPVRLWHGLDLCALGKALRGAVIEVVMDHAEGKTFGQKELRSATQYENTRIALITHLNRCKACDNAEVRR